MGRLIQLFGEIFMTNPEIALTGLSIMTATDLLQQPWGRGKYFISRMLSGTLVNVNLGNSVLIYSMPINVAWKFL